MQLVFLLCVGILTVVRATPFDLDSVDRPTPFRYNVEFGHDAFSEDSEHEDGYEIGTYKSGENYNFIDESNEGKSLQGLKVLFGDLQYCELKKPSNERCVHVVNGNLFFFHVLSTVNIEDVNKAFQDAGIEECKIGKYVLKDVPEGGCFGIDKEFIFWIGATDEDIIYEADVSDDIQDLFDNIEKCDVTRINLARECCALFDENGITIINLPIDDGIEDVERAVSQLDLTDCIYDKEIGLINKDPCYLIVGDSIHFWNLNGRLKDVLDDDVDDREETSYEIPAIELSPLSLVATESVKGNIQQLKLKGLFNQRSSLAKKAKAVLPKKTQSRPKEVQKELGRWGHKHGRQGDNGDGVNKRPNWNDYLQTND